MTTSSPILVKLVWGIHLPILCWSLTNTQTSLSTPRDTGIWGRVILCGVQGPGHCGMLSSALGLCPLDTRAPPPSRGLDNQQYFQMTVCSSRLLAATPAGKAPGIHCRFHEGRAYLGTIGKGEEIETGQEIICANFWPSCHEPWSSIWGWGWGIPKVLPALLLNAGRWDNALVSDGLDQSPSFLGKSLFSL